MELAIGLIVIVGAGYLLYLRNQKSVSQVTPEPEAPYKTEAVEAPAVVEVEPVKESAPQLVVQEKPAKARRTTAKKPKAATEKAPAKKTPKLKRSK